MASTLMAESGDADITVYFGSALASRLADAEGIELIAALQVKW